MDNTTALRTLNGLQTELSRYPAGAKVVLYLGVDRDMSVDDLQTLEAELKQGGMQLAEHPAIGTDEWANTVKLVFYNPEVPAGISFLPIPVLIILAVGVVGIGGVLGWKIGGVFDNIGDYILPLGIIAGAVLVLIYAPKFGAKKA